VEAKVPRQSVDPIDTLLSIIAQRYPSGQRLDGWCASEVAVILDVQMHGTTFIANLHRLTSLRME
jgi:hypothetical protein